MSTMSQVPESIEAIELKDLATATGRGIGSLRAAVHKGAVDGAFYEYSYPTSNRAKIMVPFDTAKLFTTADHKPVDEKKLRKLSRPTIPDVTRDPGEKDDRRR